MADVISGTWTVQEYTCDWEPIGEPFEMRFLHLEMRFLHPVVVEDAAESAAARMAGREGIATDWGAVDGDVRYMELWPRAGAPVRVMTRAQVRVAYAVTVMGA